VRVQAYVRGVCHDVCVSVCVPRVHAPWCGVVHANVGVVYTLDVEESVLPPGPRFARSASRNLAMGVRVCARWLLLYCHECEHSSNGLKRGSVDTTSEEYHHQVAQS
jgi:hypothetical protein